jgi:hypothetical protein
LYSSSPLNIEAVKGKRGGEEVAGYNPRAAKQDPIQQKEAEEGCIRRWEDGQKDN